MTKVLLVNCVEPRRAVDFKFDGLGLGYITSYIREYGGFDNVKIVDVGGVKDFGLIENFKPDIVGLSSITQNFNIAKKISSEIKSKLDIPVVVGGYHISGLPNNLTADMDVGVVGEGEQTFLELLFSYERDGLIKDKLSVVDGLVYRSDGVLKFTSKRRLIKPLDEIPFPARNLCSNRSGHHYMFTSRGCSYSCSFCSSSAFWGCIRFFSPEYVVSEIKHLIDNYSVKHITFYDDLFIANKKRVRRIAELLKKEKLDVSFSCSIRANLVDAEIASILKSMNVTRVSMGLESGCNKTLKNLKGSSVSVKNNFDAVRLLKRFHFGVGGSFVIGSPDESERDIMKTLDFIRESGVNVGETYVLMPFPNTKIWNYCKGNGLVNDFMDWSKFGLYFENNPDRIIVSEKISRKQLVAFDLMFKKQWKRLYWKYVLVYSLFHWKESLGMLLMKFGDFCLEKN